MARTRTFSMWLMMRLTLYQTNTPSWNFIVLDQWNNSPRIDMSPHLNTLSWFRANQSLPFLLHAACCVFGLTRSGLDPTIYHTRGEHANHYTTDTVHNYKKRELLFIALYHLISLAPIFVDWEKKTFRGIVKFVDWRLQKIKKRFWNT